MSSTALPVTAVQAPRRPAGRLPVMTLVGRFADMGVALGVGEVRSVAVSGTRGTVDIETVLFGDVSVLVDGLGFPVEKIVVEESRDIGVVRTLFQADYHGWAMTIQHVVRTPSIETQEGQPSAS